MTSVAVIVLLVGACGDAKSQNQAAPPEVTSTASTEPTQSAPATPDNTPLPQHVIFAAGDVIATGGRAGVVFVDPATGSAEGWLLDGVPDNYSLSLGSSDGHLLLYRCQHHGESTSLPGCEPPNAWYLFDMRTGHRLRLDTFSATPYPTIVWPEGDEVLGMTEDGAALEGTERPTQARSIALPTDYRLDTGSALWDRDGTRLLVSVFKTNSIQCRSGVEPSSPRVCSGGSLLRQLLLIDRTSGAITQLSDGPSSFVWSPDGSMFAVTRASAQINDSSQLAVYTSGGKLLWSQQRAAIFPNPTWSPDGSFIAIQILSKPEQVASAMRLDVLNTTTGDTRYRIVGAIACEGRLWTADGTRLILPGAYGFERSVVADPRDGTLRALTAQLSPSPTEPDIAYPTDAGASVGTTAVNIDSGATRPPIASFASPMASTILSGSPLFGTRFAFIATVPGGRGGCAEAIDDMNPPTTHFEYPPFAD